MVNKTISIPELISSLLKEEENASGLITKLLTDHYAGISPEKAIQIRISNLKNDIKLENLRLEKKKTYVLKMADLDDMKQEAGDRGITEHQIKAWEEKWQ